MCDQVAQIQENILCVKEERRFLLKKLIEHDPEILVDINAISQADDEQQQQPPTKKATKKQRSNSEASNKSRNSTNNKLAAISATPQKKQIIQTISVDTMGRPIYPIHMGPNLSVYDLGTVVFDRPGYHTENWIYPVGYIATRIYGNIKEPEKKCVYTCKITDGGDYPRYVLLNFCSLIKHNIIFT